MVRNEMIGFLIINYSLRYPDVSLMIVFMIRISFSNLSTQHDPGTGQRRMRVSGLPTVFAMASFPTSGVLVPLLTCSHGDGFPMKHVNLSGMVGGLGPCLDAYMDKYV